MYRHCIFDLYGTLVDIRTDERSPGLWEDMAELYRRRGVAWEPEALQKSYFRLIEELEGSSAPAGEAHEAHPEIRIEEVFSRLYREKGVEADPKAVERAGLAFRRRSTAYLRLYPGAAELLRGLRDRGRGVWLLSNAQGLFTRWELDRLGLSGLFDGVYLSSDYGCKKPDPRFFRVLLEERGIDPGSAVMTGNDGRCDIEGGRALGLDTVYVRSNLSPEEPLPRAGHVLEAMDLGRVGKILGLDGP